MGKVLKVLLILLLTLAFLTAAGYLLAKWVISNAQVTDDTEIADIISDARMENFPGAELTDLSYECFHPEYGASVSV